jgi:predicted permease
MPQTSGPARIKHEEIKYEDMLRDLVYASRTLRKSPVFTATAVATIALGIGASTAIFSVTNAVLLRPLPYKDPGRLAFVCTDLTRRNVKDSFMSNTDFVDLRNGAKRNFEDLAAVFAFRGVVAKEDGSFEQVKRGLVTTNFLRMMGGKIAAGRDFMDSDGTPQPPQQPGGQNAAPGANAQRQPAITILSYEYWQRRYGGSTAILGKTTPFGAQIVGVLAPGFELLLPPSLNMDRAPDMWFAARAPYDNAARNTLQWWVIGRLRDGANFAAAQTELDTIAVELKKNNRIQATAGLRLRLEPMQKYIVTAVRPAILALMGAVIFLLLIACANVANLLLVRASLRERELAVRTALGGSAWRLMRQMLAESLLLSGVGTALGFGLAWFGIHELLEIAPANLPRLDAIRMDPSVLVFSAIAGLAAAAIFGLIPALRASRPDLIQALRASGRTAGLGGGKLIRNAVVIAEVALSFVLLIGSGLMFRSFLALQRIDPGFDAHGVLTFQLLGGRPGQQPQQRAAFQRDLATKLKAIPGVQGVTASSDLPLADLFTTIRWGKEEALSDPSKYQATDFQIVIPGYFDTMRVPLLSGRVFTEMDNVPELRQVVVDQTMAAKAFPNENAVGKRILLRFNTPEPEWFEVIGVVGHERNTSLAEAGREQVYFVDAFAGFGAGRWALRTAGDPAQYSGAVRAAVAAVDRTIIVNEMQPMDALVQKAQSGTRFSLLLIGVFAVVSAALAGVGLYGVLSTVVRQRTAEIGVRIALGAEPGGIFGLIVGHGLRLSAAGIALGLVAALVLTRAMTSMLVGVKATDPATFAGMAALFFMIAGLASWLPARRAAGLDPNSALREE